MKLIVKYSSKYPYLPVGVGDNCHDLGRVLGISASVVSHAIHRDSSVYKVVEIEPEMYPDNDGNLWYYNEEGKVVTVKDYES